MKSSLSWFTLVTLTVGLAGCGGGGSTSPTPVGAATPIVTSTATPAASPSPGATAVPASWTFGGGTGSITATSGQTPTLGTISSYGGFTSVTIQFGTSTAGSGTLNLSDALDTTDVTPIAPNVSPLPTDTVAAYLKVLYISVYNGGLQTLGFGTSTPTIVVNATAGTFAGSTTCELDTYSANGGGAVQWNATPATGAINGGGTSVTVPATSLGAGPGNSVDIQAGQQVVAVACK